MGGATGFGGDGEQQEGGRASSRDYLADQESWTGLKMTLLQALIDQWF